MVWNQAVARHSGRFLESAGTSRREIQMMGENESAGPQSRQAGDHTSEVRRSSHEGRPKSAGDAPRGKARILRSDLYPHPFAERRAGKPATGGSIDAGRSSTTDRDISTSALALRSVMRYRCSNPTKFGGSGDTIGANTATMSTAAERIPLSPFLGLSVSRLGFHSVGLSRMGVASSFRAMSKLIFKWRMSRVKAPPTRRRTLAGPFGGSRFRICSTTKNLDEPASTASTGRQIACQTSKPASSEGSRNLQRISRSSSSELHEVFADPLIGEHIEKTLVDGRVVTV